MSPGLFFDSNNKYIYGFNEMNTTERKPIADPFAPFEITEQNPEHHSNRGAAEHKLVAIPNEQDMYYMFSGFTFDVFTLKEDGTIKKKFHHRIAMDVMHNSDPAFDSIGDIMILGESTISLLSHFDKKYGFAG